MANTQHKKKYPGYGRSYAKGWEGRRWQDIADNPKGWNSYEEYERVFKQREALQDIKKFDKETWEKGLPKRIPCIFEDHKYALVFTEKARDELIANGHRLLITAEKNGFKYYFFQFTFEINADLVNYFEEGIDYAEGSVM